MNKFYVIKFGEREWMNVISQCINYDFYHTSCYHSLELNHNKNGEPLLCIAQSKTGLIAFPLVFRSIPETEYYDCTSVYGYPGPISNQMPEHISNDLITFFQNELLKFFKLKNVISAFSGIHPFTNSKIINGIGVCNTVNKTVAIDLRLPVEEQRKQYRKSNKSEINKLRKKGYEVVEAKSNDDIKAFVDIYRENMHRVNAAPYYFFDNDYFYGFLNNECFDAKLLLVKDKGIIVAGAIFSIVNNLMQYHLAGTSKSYLKETPMKLILDEARMIGNKMKLDILHLGGGVGGSDSDSLFKFKSGFSNFRLEYRNWKLIVNQKIYNQMIIRANVDLNSNYFPLYRAEEIIEK